MKIVNIHEAKTKLSALLAEVEATGEKVRICRHGKPVADLVPHRKRSRLEPHPVMRKIHLNYDPIEPLAEDEWPENSR
jgi:prevent-host-death family protein